MFVIESVRKGPFQRTILGVSEVTFPEKETCTAVSMQCPGIGGPGSVSGTLRASL